MGPPLTLVSLRRVAAKISFLHVIIIFPNNHSQDAISPILEVFSNLYFREYFNFENQISRSHLLGSRLGFVRNLRKENIKIDICRQFYVLSEQIKNMDVLRLKK